MFSKLPLLSKVFKIFLIFQKRMREDGSRETGDGSWNIDLASSVHDHEIANKFFLLITLTEKIKNRMLPKAIDYIYHPEKTFMLFSV
jgi:hypothetical protein